MDFVVEKLKFYISKEGTRQTNIPYRPITYSDYCLR